MVGVDIVDINRISRALARYGDRFLEKCFSSREVEYIVIKKRSSETAAGRFAAKEAFMKAAGRRLAWKEIEVLQTGGRPFILYRGETYEGVSISHERSYAVAMVVTEAAIGKPDPEESSLHHPARHAYGDEAGGFDAKRGRE